MAAEWALFVEDRATRDLVANAAEERVGSCEIGTRRERGHAPRLLQLGHERLRARQRLVERHLALLDREQLVAERSIDAKARSSRTQPINRASQQAQQVVRVLRTQLA